MANESSFSASNRPLGISQKRHSMRVAKEENRFDELMPEMNFFGVGPSGWHVFSWRHRGTRIADQQVVLFIKEVT